MLALLICIITSSLLLLVFKVFQRTQTNVFQAIVFNYITASILGFLFSGTINTASEMVRQSWFWTAIGSGLVFILVFSLISYAVKKLGVSIVTVAQKMSLVLPILFALWYLNEQLEVVHLIGILLALSAIVFVSGKHKGSHGDKSRLLLILVFLGSGMVDTLIKFGQVTFIPQVDLNRYISVIYFGAAIAGICYLLYLYVVKKESPTWKGLTGGIALGASNYISLLTFISVLSNPNFPSAFTFPVINMGIILFSTFTARIAFKEPISNKNWIGIAMALSAILVMSFV